MAGLYAAWRLLTSGVRPDRIGLFEVGSRIGGRVMTVRPPGNPHLALDMGAHNFSSTHRIVGGLVERFGLKTVPGPGRSPSEIVHLRGRSLTNAEIARSWLRKPFPYDVSTYVQRRGPARILRKALEKIPRGDDGERYLDGRHLAEWTLPDALLQAMTPEELNYLADRLFYSFWRQPVQADATLKWLAWDLFPGKNRVLELAGGMSQLPDALAAAIGQLGGGIELGHRLGAVDLPREPAAPIVLHFEAGGARRTVSARRVVLALPPGAVARVAGIAGLPSIESLLAALVPQRAATVALVYGDAWWKRAGLDGGSTVTDLPARHLRHYGAEAWRANAGQAALLSYSDGENADFWRGLSRGASGWMVSDHPVVVELHSQVSRMFVPKLGETAPQPVGAFMQDWGEQTAGSAFHLWAKGSRPQDTMNLALSPLPDQRLHICGEAWSPRQAWMEGALETVETVLDRYLADAG